MELRGSVVFSSGRQRNYNIYTLNLETGSVSQLTSGSHTDDAPKWSPDGKQIVYVSDKTGSRAIWVMDERGDQQTCLTEKDSWHNSPSWSPDGSRIVYTANYEGSLDIYTMAHDGTDIQRLTDYSETDSTPSYSYLGDKIIFSSQRSSKSDLWSYDCETKKMTQLTDVQGKDYFPVYSPDDKRIAFSTGISDKKSGEEYLELCVMDADGEHQQMLKYGNGKGRQTAWSPDGRHLIYISSLGKGGRESLRVMDFENKKLKDLEFDRKALDFESGDLDNPPKKSWIRFIPKGWLKALLLVEEDGSTDRFPDWKF